MGKETPGTLADRSQPRHFIAALVATCLSLVLHWATIELFPVLPVGRPADAALSKKTRAVSLGGVHRQYERKTARPAAYRPEDPQRVAEALALVESEFPALRRDVEPNQLNADLGATPALSGENEALLTPEAAEDRTAWSPRQEIVAIQDGLFPAEVSALPRRFIASSQRIDDAVDVSWSVDQAAEETMSRIQPGSGDGRLDHEGSVSARLKRFGTEG